MARSDKTVPGSILSKRLREQVEIEVISSEARVCLTRLLRKAARGGRSEDAHQFELIRVNKIVNLANTVLGRPIYTLELHDWDYEPAEYAWHNGEFELVMKRPDTAQLIEILVDLVDQEALSADDVNAILEADGCGIRLVERHSSTTVALVDIADLPGEPLGAGEHANVRKLAERMDRAMQDRDWSLVLHTAASIFETVAKLVVPNPKVQKQSLGGWFGLYRKHSRLAAPLLETIEEIFQRRNIEPLAAHGSPVNPSITEEEAIQVRELTIALVRMERTLATVSTSVPPSAKKYKRTLSSAKRKSSRSS
jgi:hypothetical protein